MINQSKAVIDYYVAVPDRESSFFDIKGETYKEIIMPGTFRRSLEANSNICADINHQRVFALHEDIEAWEDQIGLRVIIKTNDLEILAKLMNKEITGCSFTFQCLDEVEEKKSWYTLRKIKKLMLFKITFTDDKCKPIYKASALQNLYIPKELFIPIAEYRLKLIKEKY